jgi:prevent-host-death family protein
MGQPDDRPVDVGGRGDHSRPRRRSPAVCYGCYAAGMRRLSQRELRNQSAAVLRDLANGESFLITNHGQPVGKLIPAGETAPELRVSKPATRRGGWANLPLHEASESTRDILDDLRADRI